MAWQLIFVTCRFAGLFCCVRAFRLEATPGTWLASFALAYAIGLVVPGAQGLGIFETTLLMRLGTAVPDAGCAVVLSYRLVSTLADVVAAAALQADLDRPSWVELEDQDSPELCSRLGIGAIAATSPSRDHQRRERASARRSSLAYW